MSVDKHNHNNTDNHYTTDNNVILKHSSNSYGAITSEIYDKNSNKLIAPIHYKYPERIGFVKNLGIDNKRLESTEVIHEGSVVRLYQWNGKTYLSTFRRYDGTFSHWNDSESFEDIVKRCLNISTLDQWFKLQSNKGCAFMFTIVHPKLRGVSKNPLTEYLLLIKVFNQFDGSEVPLKNFTDKITPFPYEDLFSGRLLNLKEKCYIDTQSVTKKEADAFLHYGFMLPYKNSVKDINTANGKKHLNPVLLPGEQLVIKYFNNNGDRRIFKLLSPSMSWRKSIRANTFNFTERLWELSTYAKVIRKDFDYNKIREMFLTQLNFKNISVVHDNEHNYSEVAIPFTTRNDIKYNFYSIMYMIFKNILVSASVEDQGKVRLLLSEFYKQQTDLKNKLEKFIPKVNNEIVEMSTIPRYFQQFIEGCNNLKDKRTSMPLTKIINQRISITSGRVLYSIYRYLENTNLV